LAKGPRDLGGCCDAAAADEVDGSGDVLFAVTDAVELLVLANGDGRLVFRVDGNRFGRGDMGAMGGCADDDDDEDDAGELAE